MKLVHTLSTCLFTFSLLPLFSDPSQAYSLDFLNSSDAGGGFTSFNFVFTVEPNEEVQPLDTLVIDGFENPIDALVNEPIDNPSFNPLLARAAILWDASGIIAGEPIFETFGGFAGFKDAVAFQTLSVIAESVPNDLVVGDFQGTLLDPTPVPEPFTVVSSLAALGFGAFGQKKFVKQKKRQDEDNVA